MSERKAGIIRIAGSLFAERGFQGTSLRDIGDAADLLRGSLYSHFTSKQEILRMILEPAVAELRQVITEAAESPGSGRERLEKVMVDAVGCARRHRDAILVLFQDRLLIEELPELREVVDEAKAITPIWLSCIGAGQGDGTIRSDIAPATIALAMISLLVGALSDRHLGLYASAAGSFKDRASLGFDAATLIFEGIVPR